MPVTVSTDKLATHGHAVYGVVRGMTEQLPRSRWPYIMTDILVEVHSIPRYEIDWRHALLWKNPPSHTVHIQPHAFLHPSYVPLPLDTPEVANVVFSLESIDPHGWEVLRRPKPVPRLPAPSEYPSPSTTPSAPPPVTFMPHPYDDRFPTMAAEPIPQKKRTHEETTDGGEVSPSTSLPARFWLKQQYRDNRKHPAT